MNCVAIVLQIEIERFINLQITIHLLQSYYERLRRRSHHRNIFLVRQTPQQMKSILRIYTHIHRLVLIVKLTVQLLLVLLIKHTKIILRIQNVVLVHVRVEFFGYHLLIALLQ